MSKSYLDPRMKFASTLDATFSSNISANLPLDELEFTFSKRTGKIKHVTLSNKIIATLRSDGGFALTLDGAALLLNTNKIKESCIIVRNDVRNFIKNGRSVFCKHVIFCGNDIKAGSDVIILDEDNNLLAVGKAVLPSSMIKAFKRGIAVKIRHAIND